MKASFATELTGVVAITLLVVLAAAAWSRPQPAAEAPSAGYKVLAPISHKNLTIFPVVAATTHDTRMFLTLDEGLRSGEVVITEAGQVQGLLRRRRGTPLPPRRDGAEVNRLVLVNNSSRPLLLLAGEIVSGGKQDRVVGKDRIVPPNSDPVDLSVFCVEPGRWVATSATFGGIGSGSVGGIGTGAYATPMAQPSVRAGAMAKKSQQEVWSEVRNSASAMETVVGAPAAAPLHSTTSYARVMSNEDVQKQVDAVAAPVERSYQSVIGELRRQNAVGVVVAINGELVWADIFASTPLLEKYWPKLVRSYATEAVTRRGKAESASVKEAQAFLDNRNGTRQMVETEPGVFRHTEIVGQGFHAFELASLLPKTGFDVHVSKMAE